ncbi:MAG: cache domain-containing protein [Sediminibacterium sp.]
MKKQFLLLMTASLLVFTGYTQKYPDPMPALSQLVKEASREIQTRGEAAFKQFRMPGSKWRQGETYIFVMDPQGNMLVHPDPDMEGDNQLYLTDIKGKPIIQGLIDAVSTFPDRKEGWYHYQWPVPGGILPRWKSSFVQQVSAPSGNTYIVGSGIYNDRMERAFVTDLVENAVAQIEKNGKGAFPLLHDPKGPFIAKDAYVFVTDTTGIELVNPYFPNLEGRKLIDLKDSQGKYLVREMLNQLKSGKSGWVDYLWPKPGESAPTLKSTYVAKARMGDGWVLVGCGVYLADAPKAEVSLLKKMTATELKANVHEAAAIFAAKGEKAFPEFRKEGSKWFHDDTYFFVWTMDGVRLFHAADSAHEGINVSDMKDALGRPIGKMFLETGSGASGEGWIHYMYPEPGDIFPTWKSTYVKRVTFPSGIQYLVGCGIYNMQMDQSFIEDVVDRASRLIAEKGSYAFPALRDKMGSFVFMNTYVFVQSTDGTELVNAAQPSFEGKNLIDLKDLKGKKIIRDQIQLAMEKGAAWMDCYWYTPGDNRPALKRTYVRKVQHKGETYIVGSGLYIPE